MIRAEPNRPCDSCTHAQRRADELYARLNAASGRVDDRVIPIPWLIIASDHGLPIWEDEAGHFACPGFDAPPMLLDVRAYRLDLNDLYARSQACLSPSVSRQQAVIYAVADNVPTQAQIVLRYCVSRAIASVV
jgi:hypothetical protein